MKFYLVLILTTFVVNASVLNRESDDDNNLIPFNICANVPSGTAFPVAYDCNQFILCVNRVVTIGRCPPNIPYFDPCSSMCSSWVFVCSRGCIEEPEETTMHWPVDPTEAPEEPVDEKDPVKRL